MDEKKLSFSRINVIGGGPAGLMAAEHLSSHGFSVAVYDAKPAVLRKFLVAGKGGLNFSGDEDFEKFLSRYGNHAHELEPFLRTFGPIDLRNWVHNLGFETFVGSSGKIFPSTMQAVPLRFAWIKRLEQQGISFHLNHRWLGWDREGNLVFQNKSRKVFTHPDAVILALGGASWPSTGSDGTWRTILEQRGIHVTPFKPANCGFNVSWSEHFRQKYAGTPLKSVELHFSPEGDKELHQKGEFVISDYGVEGNLIYKFSALIREEIFKNGKATIYLDLAPDWDHHKLVTRLAKPRGSRSLANHIFKSTGLRDAKTGLIYEFFSKTVIENPITLAEAIKSVPIPLISPRPIEEAISTAGGVSFDELTDDLMISKLPGVFCAGEMLDWEAPTGGYLLTACFSTGRAAAGGVISWLEKTNY